MKEYRQNATEPAQQTALQKDTSKSGAKPNKTTPEMIALRLTVYNHPGVMSHVCGLFARRAFNVESIFVVPIANSDTSRIWLLVHDDDQLDQMIRQTRKLHDVIDLAVSRDAKDIFQRFTTFMEIWESTDPQIANRR